MKLAITTKINKVNDIAMISAQSIIMYCARFQARDNSTLTCAIVRRAVVVQLQHLHQRMVDHGKF